MANTFSASLLIDTLSEQLITVLGNKFAPLSSFSRNYSDASASENANIQVKKATGGSTTLTSPTNWEQGNSTVTNVNVLIKSYAQPFHISSAELNGGKQLEDLAKINAQTFANKILDIAFAPVTTANFNAFTQAAASFHVDNLQTLWANVAKSDMRHLILDAVPMSKLMPTNTQSFKFFESGAYGFDGIYLNTRWNGANTNAYGFACGSEAIATAARMPDVHPAVANLMLDRSTVTLDGLGMSVALNVWGSASSRTVWASYDILFGSALGDNTGGTVLVSA